MLRFIFVFEFVFVNLTFVLVFVFVFEFVFVNLTGFFGGSRAGYDVGASCQVAAVV